ncbi:MAG TPA: hypothetical protein VFB80_09055, partial [Pirellulaceae bacterium]|nr:hypothetical protein [Pirellulaceae bacterium]
SGTVWSLGPGGQAQGQIGRWEQQGDRVRFQWAASSQGFDVQFQQQPYISSPDIYLFSYLGRGSSRRTSNSFGPDRALVGPQRQIYGRSNALPAGPVVARGDVALDLRTFTGQSIDGVWRPIEIVGNPRLTQPIRHVPGQWQSVRFIIDGGTPPRYGR